MDKRIRKYILYKARTLEERKRELKKLQAKRSEMREDLIDSSNAPMDGQPTGKGKIGNPTELKALKLLEIDRRIKRLQEEIQVFNAFEKRVTGLQKDIYIETVKKDCTDLTAKAQQLCMGRRQLIEGRAKILRYLAQELGEWLKDDE